VGDQPRAASSGQEAERPAGEDEQAILEADEIEDVDGEPDQPGRHSADLDALDVRDRAGAPDGGEVALVDVAEGPRRASGDALRGSVLTVFADAVANFKPDHILIALRSSEHANWQERGLIEHATERFGLPLTTFAIDPEGHEREHHRGMMVGERWLPAL
jgi:hypothetical protein